MVHSQTSRDPRDPGEGIARSCHRLAERLFAPVDIASLLFFRVFFGVVMLWEVARYFRHGWIHEYYIAPAFHFTYYGFQWVGPWPGAGMYWHFAALGLLAFLVSAGLLYRAAAALFFLGFAYVFLLEQARYLNHFYLVVLLSFLMIFLPARRGFSLDAWRRPEIASASAPGWALWSLRALVGIPYFYGGLAKLNADWMRGEPMGQWLRSRADFPLVGQLFGEPWVPVFFSWASLLLDLAIVPLLLWRRSRSFALAAAIVFHLMNARLFRIGIFPWLMVGATLLFLPPGWPRRFGFPPRSRVQPGEGAGDLSSPPRRRATLAALLLFFGIQAIVPLRHLLYPGDVNWTEEGHRFAWHMKLRDKEANARFFATDPRRNEVFEIAPGDSLRPWQAEKMSTRPDMILQFAHQIARDHSSPGSASVEVTAWVEASLNGRPPQLLIDPTADLAAQPRALAPSLWILPLKEPYVRPYRETVEIRPRPLVQSARDRREGEGPAQEAPPQVSP